MDDNHFWKEFLAYHYTFLNLRRLIVAVDPRSRTSPAGIFSQWKDLINITVLTDKHLNISNEQNVSLTKLHRRRQRRLYHRCSAKLKKEDGTTWVAYIDVDEYIVPNWRAGPFYRIERYQPEMNIFDVFDYNPHLNTDFSYSCFPMSRVDVNVRESSREEVFENVPAGINATSLMTLRYRNLQFMNNPPLPGKSMVDLSRVEGEEIFGGNHEPHQPILSQCDESDVWISPIYSAFMIFHYQGTLEAFLFRDDSRKKNRKTDANYQKRHNGTKGVLPDTSARFWISNFVSKVGLPRAQELLAGADLVGLEY
jgi:hypothetical protein